MWREREIEKPKWSWSQGQNALKQEGENAVSPFHSCVVPNLLSVYALLGDSKIETSLEIVSFAENVDLGLHRLLTGQY